MVIKLELANGVLAYWRTGSIFMAHGTERFVYISAGVWQDLDDTFSGCWFGFGFAVPGYRNI